MSVLEVDRRGDLRGGLGEVHAQRLGRRPPAPLAVTLDREGPIAARRVLEPRPTGLPLVADFDGLGALAMPFLMMKPLVPGVPLTVRIRVDARRRRAHRRLERILERERSERRLGEELVGLIGPFAGVLRPMDRPAPQILLPTWKRIFWSRCVTSRTARSTNIWLDGRQWKSNHSTTNPLGTSRYSSNFFESRLSVSAKYWGPKTISPSCCGGGVRPRPARGHRSQREQGQKEQRALHRRNLIPAGWFEP
jgi:hypothetical protein